MSPANSVRRTLNGWGGKTLETFGMNGLPALLGANMSGSLALGVPFMGDGMLSTIGGVYEGQAKKLMQAGSAAMRGDLYRTVANLSPEFMRGPVVAAEESGIGREIFGTPGYSSTAKGRPMYDENGKLISMGPGEAVAKSIGFNPTDTARQKEMNQTVRRQEAWAADQKASAGEKYRIAKIQKDPDALKNLMHDVRDINQGIRDRGLQKLIPLTSVSKVIQSSRQVVTAKERREKAYKVAQL